MIVNIFKDTIPLEDCNHPNLLLFVIEQYPEIDLKTAYILAGNKLQEIKFYKLSSQYERANNG